MKTVQICRLFDCVCNFLNIKNDISIYEKPIYIRDLDIEINGHIINFIIKKCTNGRQITFENGHKLICANKHILYKNKKECYAELFHINDYVDIEDERTLKIINIQNIDDTEYYDISIDYPHIYYDSHGIKHHNSAISYAVANYYDNAYFVTIQKILQEQYKHDFNMPAISAKKNYQCNRVPSCTCANCLRSTLNLKKCPDCPHMVAFQTAFDTNYCTPNYAYLLAIAGASGDIGNMPDNINKRDLVVCDECHRVPDELISRGTIEIDIDREYYHQKLFASNNFMDMPDFSTMSDEEVISFFTTTYEQFVAAKLDECIMKLGGFPKSTKLSKQQIREIRNLTNAKSYWREQHCHIDDMMKFALPDVVVNNSNNKASIKPLFANGFFHSLLKRYGDRFLFMSATILDKEKFCEELQINEDDCEYIQLGSVFPVENRPIYYWPSGSMSYKEKKNTYPQLCKDIDAILSKHKDDKGIIHCVNYEVASEIRDALVESDNYDRFVFVNAENKNAQLDEFQKSVDPLVLVSPSLNEGLDLKDDLSRLCIICKVPYASLGDRWVQKKLEIDQKWYDIKTAETLIQQTGRSIRSKTDYAMTYILDADFIKFYRKNEKLFPDWWKDSIQWY